MLHGLLSGSEEHFKGPTEAVRIPGILPQLRLVLTQRVLEQYRKPLTHWSSPFGNIPEHRSQLFVATFFLE